MGEENEGEEDEEDEKAEEEKDEWEEKVQDNKGEDEDQHNSQKHLECLSGASWRPCGMAAARGRRGGGSHVASERSLTPDSTWTACRGDCMQGGASRSHRTSVH